MPSQSQKLMRTATAGLCTLLLAGAPMAYAADTPFQDTAGHWAEAAIQRMSSYQIVSGYQGKFRPNDSITRGEMAVILDHVMRYQQHGTNPFTDLGEAFYTDAILKAVHAGVLQGADGKVRPKDSLSREEAVVMIARAFEIQNTNPTIPTPDANAVSSWAAPSVAALMAQGYLNDTDAFRPKASITRAEIVTILNRVLTGYHAEPGTVSDAAEGTVVVNTPGVVFQNTVIAGDLILTEGIQEGDVTLENVTVKGRTLIHGGGAHSIHVMGNSSLGDVVMERTDAPVRLAVQEGAKVDRVVVSQKSNEAILTGPISNVSVAGKGTLTTKDAHIDNLSVDAPNASVVLEGNSNVETIAMSEKAENANVSVAEKASVQTIQADAAGSSVSGKGTVKTIKANANNVTVDTKGTTVTAAPGVSGVTASGKPVAGGTSTNTGGNGGSSGGGGSSSGGGSGGGGTVAPQTELKIDRVESIRNGLVRLTLNRATEKPLVKDQISIICTGAGKNMTILDVHTNDRRVYDIVTAYYNDNTYQLGLTLENNRLLTYNFVSKYDCPAITSVQVVRTTDQTAEFSYVSDIDGTFYWLLVPEQQVQPRDSATEPTAEEIMKKGSQQPMKLHDNIVALSDLQEHTAYTLYYVAKGSDDKVTSVKSLPLAGEPVPPPPVSDITIEKAKAQKTYSTDFIDEHIYFEIELSRATDTALTLEQFKFSCPTDAKIHLGRVETTDQKRYKVYMEKGYMVKDNNNFTCTISFADGTQATKTFFVDLTAPNLTAFKIDRLPNHKAKVQFTSSEPGKIYYDVLTGKEFGSGESGAKDPNLVIKNGKTLDITAGSQFFEVDFSKKAEKDNLFFCVVSEDSYNNRSTFWYESIPNTETTPDPQPQPSEHQIVRITGQVKPSSTPDGPGHVLNVTTNKNDTASAQFSIDTITITGENTSVSGHQKIIVDWSNSNPTEHIISLRGITLKKGTYTLKAELRTKTGSETVTKTFTVNDDADFTITSE